MKGDCVRACDIREYNPGDKMCGANDLQAELCYYKTQQDEQGDLTTATPSHSCSSRSQSGNNNNSSNSVEKVWKETQQLMDDREQLVRIMTHVCSSQQQFSSSGPYTYRTLARYSQGCWRGCSASERRLESVRGFPHHYVHPHTTPSSHTPPSSTPSAFHHPSCSVCSFSSSQGQLQMPSSIPACKGCVSSVSASSVSGCPTTRLLPQEEDLTSPSPSSASSSSPSSCRWRGGCCSCRRSRWRWGRSCQCPCVQCHSNRKCSGNALMKGATDSGGSPLSSPIPTSTPPSSSEHLVVTTSTTTSRPTNTTHSQTNLRYHSPVPVCSTATTTTVVVGSRVTNAEPLPPSTSPSYAPARRGAIATRRTAIQLSSQTRTASPKPRGGAPTHPSLLTILLLLVVTLARFTDGCSSRSTPKPRPASPTMRPNITFQTYACPPAYAAWYCLNGATCFTVKIGESILYNCECAEGYMGQRCEFKDLDGSYLPAREKVLLETASIAGGATVACVLVFIVLFAVYIFMQKDKDKRCRDLDGGRNGDRQPFSGYQNPRPEVFRTISNPYARTLDELSNVEVESAGHGINTGTEGRIGIGSGNTAGGRGGNSVDSNLHHNGQHQASSPAAS